MLQLTNVQVGEYHGDTKLAMREGFPINYHPVTGEAKALEDAFIVLFDAEHVSTDELFVSSNLQIRYMFQLEIIYS